MVTLPPIHCLVCGIQGAYGERGWRLASNRPGGYTCGSICDQFILDLDAAARAEAKKLKEKRRVP